MGKTTPRRISANVKQEGLEKLTNKYALALHTTSPELGLALSNFGGDSRSQVWDLGRSLSTHLHYHLGEFLQPQTWADLAFIAVAKGPGSYTSTRMGVVTARTLAQQLDIPLFAVSSLEAIALAEKSQAEILAIQLPAQSDRVYAAIYQVTAASSVTPLLPDSFMTTDAWQNTLENWHTPYKLIQPESGLGVTVTSVLELAYLNWQQGKLPTWTEALPFYGQQPVEL